MAPDPILTIGAGTSALELNKVVGAATLSDGRLIVLNGNPVAAYLVTSDGRLVRSFARQGGGPGEFRSPQHLFVQGDAALIWDRDFGSGYAFDTLGRVTGEHHVDLDRVQRALGDSLVSEQRFPVPGLGIIARVARRAVANSNSAGWEQKWGNSGYFLLDPLYRGKMLNWYPHIVTAARGPISGRPAVVMPMFFALSHITLDQTDGPIFVSSGSEFRVDEFGRDGQLRRSIRALGGPIMVDDSTHSRLSASMRSQHRFLSDAEYAAALKVLPDSRQYPSILGLLVDTDHHLWVRRSLREWVVFDPSGKLVATAELPLFKVFEIRHERIVGLAVDADGVESVVELSLRRN